MHQPLRYRWNILFTLFAAVSALTASFMLMPSCDSDGNAGFGLMLSNQPKWSVATVTPGQFQIFNDAIGQNAVWIDPSNNNVGIGSGTPAAKLEVNGYTKLGSDAPAIRVKKLTGTTPASRQRRSPAFR